MKFLFVADPIERLKPKGDSTLVLLRECRRRGHETYWATDKDIEYIVDQVFVHAHSIGECLLDELPVLGTRNLYPMRDLDAVFIRKDPPFNEIYVRLCWLLSLAEKQVWMLNRPSLLLRYHEKLIPLEAHVQGFLRTEDLIPSHIGTLASAKDFVRSRGYPDVVLKPFLGYGGNGVQRLNASDFLALTPKASELDDVLVQPFDPGIHTYGDRRVFFLDGEILAHFVRRPAEGGFISNLAQGGSAKREPLLLEHELVLKRLGKFLKATGITLAGADLIGPRISEVNITSPTGLRSLATLEDNDFGAPIIDLAERSVFSRKK